MPAQEEMTRKTNPKSKDLMPIGNVTALKELLDSRADHLRLRMAPGADVKAYRQSWMALVMNNPDILRCSQISVLSCIDDGAFLGLDITGKGLKEAYLIPYKDKLTMIPAYYGLLKLVRQSKEIGSVDCQLVHEFDKCEWSLGTAPIVEHQPAPPSTRGEVSAVYAIAHWAISNIPPIVEWMWKEEIETIRNGSPAKNSDPWKYHWGEMARKTVLRRICKRLPKSEKVDRAVYLSDSHERPDFSNGNDIVDAEQTMKPTADKLVDKLH